MNPILGKSMMLWKIKDVQGGNPELIADHAKQMGATSLQIKAANGVSAYNLKLTATGWKDILVGPLVDALAQEGIDTWGWHYIYGTEPEREAQRAAERMATYPYKGWILDVEKEFKVADAASRARRFMSTLRGLLPDATLAFCSYRYPSYHREVPYHEFLPGCDFVMPQVYWVHNDNPAEQLARTIGEYNELYETLGLDPLPMIPVGAAYKEWGWQATAGQVHEFLDAAKNLEKLGGVSFWRHGHAIALGLDDTIADFDWPVEPVEPPTVPPTLEERISTIETNVSANTEIIEVHETRLDNLERRASTIEVDLSDTTNTLADHIANHPGGNQPPAGGEGQRLVMVAETHAQAWASVGPNDKGYPIIQLNLYALTKDPALRWERGTYILVYEGYVDSDGDDEFYKLVMDYPVHGYDALYLQARDVVEV